MTTIRLSFVAAVCVCAFNAHAQPRVRVIDINRIGASALTTTADSPFFVAIGGTAYFTARANSSGTELWRTNGTPSGTTLVKDVFPGGGSSSPSQLTQLGQLLIFVAYNPSTGVELWRTDGTEAGTSLIRDIAPLNTLANLGILAATPSLVYFIAKDGSGSSLWRTDGTFDGTFAILPLPLAGNALPAPIFSPTPVGDKLFFVTDDGLHGSELWSTDGSIAGTQLVRDIVPGPDGSSPDELAAAAGRLYFAAMTPESGIEPWTSDGTTLGTAQVADLASANSGSESSKPQGFIEVNNQIFFTASVDDSGRELWVFDTSATGSPPHLVLDILPGSSDGLATAFARGAVGGRLFFAATDNDHGNELWVTDGSTASTHMVIDLASGADDSNPVELLAHGNDLVFQATNSTDGYRLWRIDADPLSSSPPTLVTTLGIGEPRLTRPVLPLANQLLFPAFTPENGLELFISDTSAQGASLVKDIRTGTVGSSPTSFAKMGRGVVFAARTNNGLEPFVSDGSPAGTFQLADIAPGTASSSPNQLLSNAALTIFAASQSSLSAAWYRTDGSASGTQSLNITASGSASTRVAALGARFIFAGSDPAIGAEPFVTDGTISGTRPLRDLDPGIPGSDPFGFTTCGTNVLFFANNAPGLTELWRTDGTPTGTELVTILTAPSGITPISPTVRPVADTPTTGGTTRIYFDANDAAGNELWVSDGTDEGTYRIADIHPGPSGSFASGACAMGGYVLFSAADDTSGHELWRTDGVRNGPGTHRVRDIWPGPGASRPLSMLANGDRVFFAADDGATGSELWSTDGTAPGTVRLTDVYPGAFDSVFRVLAAAGEHVYFEVSDSSASGLYGRMWQTDRSPLAPQIEPVTPSRASVAPFFAAITVNNRIFFSGSDSTLGTGSELAILDLCPTDFNNSGMIDIGDIFAFLEAYFAFVGTNGPSLPADMNDDSTINLTDIYSFLQQYFVGC